MVFISFADKEGKGMVNCLQAPIEVVSTFVELKQLSKSCLQRNRAR